MVVSRAWRDAALTLFLGGMALIGTASAQAPQTAAPTSPAALPPSERQSFGPLSPKTLPPLSPPKPQADGPIPPAEGDDNELAPHLEGIVVVGTQGEVAESGAGEKVPGKKEGHVRFVSGVKPEDQKGLQAIFDSYLGKPVTLHRLNEMLREIVLFYRRQDRPVVDAYLPEQDMVDNVVQIVVTEAKQGKVTVEGNNWFSTAMIEANIRSKEGDPLRSRSLNADVGWINRNPFVQTQLVYTPGEEEGTTDIVLKTEDRFPVRPYVSYDDSGNKLTGYDRYTGGFNWGNALFLGDLFNYQFMSSGDFDKLKAHSGSYVHYFPWHHQLTVFGSYADTEANIPSGLATPFHSVGDAWQVSARYAIPLPGFKAPWGAFTHEIVGGYDFKESTSLLVYNIPGTSNSAPMADVSQFMAEYDGSLTDPLGATSFDAQYYYSPGNMMDNNTTSDFAANNASSPNYQYAKFSVNRVTRLPYDCTFIAKAEYQWANQRLIGSEQLGMGGYDTVRGYDDREANGDEGFLVSGEVRSPSWSIGHLFDDDFQSDQLQLLTFMDYGGVSQFRGDVAGSAYRNTSAADNPNINLWSVGAGVRYNLSPYVTFRFDWGWQMIDSGVPVAYRDGSPSRGHIGVTISY